MKSSYITKHFIGTAVFFSFLFIAAGRLDYWQGILYVLIGLGMSVVGYTVLRIDDDLLAERSKPGENTKSWDKKILLFSFFMTIAMYIVAGLDSGRYHWSPEFHWSFIAIGAILTGLGQFFFLFAQKQNRFFSSTVRIQTDRGHSVCDTGLYRMVRHPAYFGSFVQTLGFPLIFGSIWSIIPVVISMILLVVRTSLEDMTLRDELSGYEKYTQKTRYKLIPYIW